MSGQHVSYMECENQLSELALVRCLCSISGREFYPIPEIRRSVEKLLEERRNVGVSADTRTDLATRYHRFATLACSATIRCARYYYNRGRPLFYIVAHHACGCIQAR